MDALELRRMLGEFIGASVINVPLGALLMLGVFAISTKTSKLSRVRRVLLSYAIVAGILGTLSLFSIAQEINNPAAEQFQSQSIRTFIFQQLAFGFSLVIGLLSFGKTKPKTHSS